MEEQQNKKKKYRLGWFWIIVLIFLAGICDTVGLIPLVESISGTIFWGIAGFILWMKGCGLLNWKRFITAAVSLVVAWIPLLQDLPQLVLGIIAVIILVRVEDRTGMSLLKPLSQGKKVNLPKRPPPLNQGGVRGPEKV